MPSFLSSVYSFIVLTVYKNCFYEHYLHPLGSFFGVWLCHIVPKRHVPSKEYKIQAIQLFEETAEVLCTAN